MSLAAVVSLAAVTLLHQLAEAGRGVGAALSRLLLGAGLAEPWQDLAVLLPFVVVVVSLVSLVTLWNLRPLTRASADAARAGPRDPEARIGTRGLPSEIAPMVDAMNGALDRLQRAYEAERRFTEDAAHELRTPLAALGLRLQRARLEGAVEWPAIERDLAQMGRLVSQLLDLARREAARTGPMPLMEEVNLARIAREAAASILPIVERAGRSLAVELPVAMMVRGRPDDLRDLVRNILDNALGHGRGLVSVTGWSGASAVTLEVTDEGPGVAAGMREAVFGRFCKGAQGTDGSGLGLAIVRAIARDHDATVGFVAGPSSRVRATFPAALAQQRAA